MNKYNNNGLAYPKMRCSAEYYYSKYLERVNADLYIAITKKIGMWFPDPDIILRLKCLEVYDGVRYYILDGEIILVVEPFSINLDY